MIVCFRVDASLQIGTGHVMRCLTLANKLDKKGIVCFFICREHEGNLIHFIRNNGYQVYSLPKAYLNYELHNSENPNFVDWLGATVKDDAECTADIVKSIKPDFLIIDHYYIDKNWEQLIKNHVKKIMVIDDLANREHVCDILLDQNLGRKAEDYLNCVPPSCSLMIGPKFALLRPEFSDLRAFSLSRIRKEVKKILITMGGVDYENTTCLILDGLAKSSLSHGCKITIVLGEKSPWIEQVKDKANQLQFEAKILIGVSNMAKLMADADLCIGAAGSTSWERCALGLPSILMCIAENQKMVLQSLVSSGAALTVDINILRNNVHKLGEIIERAVDNLPLMSQEASLITRGNGTDLVALKLIELS